ncbi:MAG: restriction endonuclease [Phycisphaerales bacterium]
MRQEVAKRAVSLIETARTARSPKSVDGGLVKFVEGFSRKQRPEAIGHLFNALRSMSGDFDVNVWDFRGQAEVERKREASPDLLLAQIRSWLLQLGRPKESILEVRPLGRPKLWKPDTGLVAPPKIPMWIGLAPSVLRLARDHLLAGRSLHALSWRQFEELIGQLLEEDGFKVQITKEGGDDGIDVVGVRNDRILGAVKSVWQAKKYGPTRAVSLDKVRELSAARDDFGATKGLMITTSYLSDPANRYVQQRQFRLGKYEGRELEQWVRRVIKKAD